MSEQEMSQPLPRKRRDSGSQTGDAASVRDECRTLLLGVQRSTYPDPYEVCWCHQGFWSNVPWDSHTAACAAARAFCFPDERR